MLEIYNTFLVHPILNVLLGLNLFTGNVGLSIILLTLLVKGISHPFMIPSMKSMKKQRELQPQLEKIKSKFKYDKQKQAELQMKLMKEHGVNPASGCLSALITFPLIPALYSVVNQIIKATDINTINSNLYFDFLKIASLDQINLKFLYLNLSTPDKFFILTLILVATQYIMMKMSLPYAETGLKAAAETPEKADDIAYNIQKQSLYTMPIMMGFFGLTLPSGVVLYLLTSTLFSIGQNYVINGWGGFKSDIDKFMKRIKK